MLGRCVPWACWERDGGRVQLFWLWLHLWPLGQNGVKWGIQLGSLVDRLSTSTHQHACAPGSRSLCVPTPLPITAPLLRPPVHSLMSSPEALRSPAPCCSPSLPLRGCVVSHRPHVFSGPQALPSWAKGCAGSLPGLPAVSLKRDIVSKARTPGFSQK